MFLVRNFYPTAVWRLKSSRRSLENEIFCYRLNKGWQYICQEKFKCTFVPRENDCLLFVPTGHQKQILI